METAVTFKTVGEAARTASKHVVTRERGEKTIYVVEDSAPEWVTDLAYAAHKPSNLLPDDYIYQWFASALEFIANTTDEGEWVEADDMHEWADAEVPVYTAQRLAWLSSNLSRLATCEKAVAEFGTDLNDDQEFSLDHIIGLGMYREVEAVGVATLEALQALVED